MAETPHWTLDRKIPVGTLLVLAAYAVTLIISISNLNTRVTALEAVKPNNSELSERVARLEEKITSMKETLTSIDGKLDRAIESDRAGTKSNYIGKVR